MSTLIASSHVNDRMTLSECTSFKNTQANCVASDDYCYCAIDPYWAVQSGDVSSCSSFQTMYWYLPDYLGHNEFITDMDGDPYQYFFYSPWGKTLETHESQQATFNTPYRFNGKELDEETGNYYYGARYYNPKVSVWLSVDPLTQKYPSLSPYAFVANNPVMLIDPDGKRIKWNLDGIIVAAAMMLTKTGREQLKARRDDKFVTYQFRLSTAVGISIDKGEWGCRRTSR